MRILHLVGQREDAGGILAVIRGLHQAGSAVGTRHTVWVHREYAVSYTHLTLPTICSV